MSSFDVTNLLLNICSQLNLSEITIPPEKLTRGVLHQNWKITTSNTNYVIKKLNSQIAQKPGIKEKYEETEQITSKLHASDTTAVAALKFGSHFVHHADKHFLSSTLS